MNEFLSLFFDEIVTCQVSKYLYGQFQLYHSTQEFYRKRYFFDANSVFCEKKYVEFHYVFSISCKPISFEIAIFKESLFLIEF